MIGALKDLQRDILKHMEPDIGKAFHEFSQLKLIITPETVTAALSKMFKKTSYTRNMSKIPQSLELYDSTLKNWATIIKTAEGIFGKPRVIVIGKKLSITLWAGRPYGTGATITKKGKFWSMKDVETNAMPKFKNAFEKIVTDLISEDDFKNFKVDRPGPRGEPVGGRGRKGFNLAFSLSHDPGPTLGQMTGQSLTEATDKRGTAAGKTKSKAQEEKEYKDAARAAGAERFFAMNTLNMARLIPAMVYLNLTTDVKSYSGALQTLDKANVKSPGSFNIEMKFDEIEAQAQAGIDSKKDLQILRESIGNWAEDYVSNYVHNPNNQEDIWFMEGSTSRANAHRILMQEVALKQIVKGGKKFKKPIKVIKKPDKIRVKANKLTPKSGKKSSVRRRTIVKPISTKKPSGSKKPLTKSGRPDMRYTANKQAWGQRGGGAHSPIGLIQLLNKALPDELKERMTGVYPRSLEWRTGRFGQSARVTGIFPFPNLTQIRYTYQKNPYQIFEPGSGSPLASGGRDPQAIIGETIREIAQSIMGTRFGLVRTKRV
jgi:hypothetical protein